MGLFSGYLLVSDIDGTLLPEYGELPPCNIEAVRHFQQEGGRFTVASGRNLKSVKETLSAFDLTEPLILTNGSWIWDVHEEKALHQTFLPSQAADYAAACCAFTGLLTMRVLLENSENHCVYVRPGATEHPLVIKRYNTPTRTIEQLRGFRWRKVLLILEPESLAAFAAEVEQHPLPNMDYTISSNTFFELIPHGASKGDALRRVTARLGIDPKKVVAIGDHQNDLDLLQAAGISACPQNATPSVKAVCDWEVCNAADGAVADLIARLGVFVKF